METRLFIRPEKRPTALMRLFCLPYAGGSASTYFHWAKNLPAEIELSIVQPPGRGSRISEPAHQCMSSLTAELLPALEPYLDRPYMLFGHSLGSRVGFDLMHQMKQRGWPEPEHFIASGSLPPNSGWHRKPIFDMPREAFIAELRKFEGTPDEVFNNNELISLLLPTLRADFRIADTYQYRGGSTFDCPVSVFGGIRDKNVPTDRLAEWKRYFRLEPEIFLFPGGHFFIESDAKDVQARVGTIAREHLNKSLTAKCSSTESKSCGLEVALRG